MPEIVSERRILHTMLRVGHMRRSVEFYTNVIGMRLLRTLDQPSQMYSLAFLGFQDEADACVLELTYNFGVSAYNHGNAYGHLAIGVQDCVAACAEIRARGGVISVEPQYLEGTNEIIAFVSDPDGYRIELIQRG